MNCISLAAGAALMVFAAPAFAESINVGGTAATICRLPNEWSTRTSVGGAIGTFAGTTWTIPTASFSQANGQPNIAGEIALRISGPAFCNSLHTIQISSANGGLRNTTMAQAPANFSNIREVKYDAHWANNGLTGTARRIGPGIVDWIPSGPGQSKTAIWNAANGIPGVSYFDLRLSVRRRDGDLDKPLVAGDYSDIVTVTLTPSS